MSQFFASGDQSTGASASASVLPMNIQDWFLLGLTGLISLQSEGPQESSPTPQYIQYPLINHMEHNMKKQRHYFANKGPSSQSYGFPSSHIWMWELDHKESWALTNWCFWIVVLEKTLESPLDCKQIQPVHPKWNQSWIFIGRTDAEAEAPVLSLPDVKNWLLGKDPDAGKDWRQEEKVATGDEMAG